MPPAFTFGHEIFISSIDTSSEASLSTTSIYSSESDAEDNNVEVYISFLRKKLDYLHSKVKIRTIRMVGYRLEQET